MLEIADLHAGYGLVPVLHGISLSVAEGEVVAVIGANGAGTSTLLRTISGLTDVTAGAITFDGHELVGRSPAAIAGTGIAHVPENRRVFPQHPVQDNLRLGAYVHRRDRRAISEDLTAVYERFPVLGDRRTQQAGTLSGGEQQMLAIGMSLMARPRLLIMDEPSLGLAPIIVEQVFAEIGSLARSGMTILLVEQLARAALGIADRGIVLRLGRIVATGSAQALRDDPEVRAAYLGT